MLATIYLLYDIELKLYHWSWPISGGGGGGGGGNCLPYPPPLKKNHGSEEASPDYARDRDC